MVPTRCARDIGHLLRFGKPLKSTGSSDPARVCWRKREEGSRSGSLNYCLRSTIGVAGRDGCPSFVRKAISKTKAKANVHTSVDYEIDANFGADL